MFIWSLANAIQYWLIDYQQHLFTPRARRQTRSRPHFPSSVNTEPFVHATFIDSSVVRFRESHPSRTCEKEREKEKETLSTSFSSYNRRSSWYTYNILLVKRARASQALTQAWIRVAAASLRFSWARSSRAAFFCCRKLPFDERSVPNILGLPAASPGQAGRMHLCTTSSSLLSSSSSSSSLTANHARHPRQLTGIYQSPLAAPPPPSFCRSYSCYAARYRSASAGFGDTRSPRYECSFIQGI